MAAQFCKSGNRIIIQNISIPPCRINRAFPLIPQTETCIYTDHKENRRVHSICCLSNNPTVISPRVPQKAPNISLPPGATLNFCGLGCHSQRSDDCAREMIPSPSAERPRTTTRTENQTIAHFSDSE